MGPPGLWVERIVAHFRLVAWIRDRRKEGFVVDLVVEIVVNRQKIANLGFAFAVGAGCFASHNYLPWPRDGF